MIKILVAASLLCSSSVFAAHNLSPPPGTDETVTVVATPQKGQTMQAVVREFGAPSRKHAAAGGDTPKHPPITRWDYAGFSVFFEHAHVVDSVSPDHPPQIYHVEQLQAASQ